MVDIKCSLSDEKELTQCIKYNPESVEEGLRIVDTFFKLFDGKEIDILAVDNDDMLVVMELKTGMDSNQLIQAMGYYDWTLNNFDTLKRIFPNINFKNVVPRVMLIAEDFHEDTIMLAQYLKDNINITLYRYIAVRHNNEKIILCNKKSIPNAPEIFIPTTEEDLFDYIDIDEIRANTKKLVEDIRALDPKVSAEVKNSWLFFVKYKGRRFGEISTTKKYINYWVKRDVYNDDSWDSFEKVKSEKDFKETFDDFKEAFDNAKKKLDAD